MALLPSTARALQRLGGGFRNPHVVGRSIITAGIGGTIGASLDSDNRVGGGLMGAMGGFGGGLASFRSMRGRMMAAGKGLGSQAKYSGLGAYHRGAGALSRRMSGAGLSRNVANTGIF